MLALLKPFDWSGGLTRAWFWGLLLAMVAISALVFVWEVEVLKAPIVRWSFLLQAIFVFPTLSITARRLHAMGRSAGWVAATMIPYLGFLAVLWIGFSKPAEAPRTGQKRPALGFVAGGILIALFVSRLFWAPFWVPSGSMKPALLVGDFFAVAFQQAGRGDIVVFDHPTQDVQFIKRLIGLPGDKITIDGQDITINGQTLVYETLADFTENFAPQGALQTFPVCAQPARNGAECSKFQRTETLPNGMQYRVLNMGEDSWNEPSHFQVPEGHFFVLGDNRGNSLDSRIPQSTGGLGFIPLENMVGTAQFIFFSSAGRSLIDVPNWRFERTFKGIQ